MLLTKLREVTKTMGQAYEKLKFYQDICELRKMIFLLTNRFDKSCYRLVSQMRDAARSAKQNIREGYAKESHLEFAHYIKISRGSLEELTGDLEDCRDDGFISVAEYNNCMKLAKSAEYLSNRFLYALYKMGKNGTWNIPHPKPTATPRNLKATSHNLT
jgi:four helix bundle protein